MMRDEDDERGVARPNDEVRAAVLEALDIADRAGVRVTCVSGMQHGDGPVRVQVFATRSSTDAPPLGSRAMPHTDALRILLRAGHRDAVESSDVADAGTLHVWHTVRTRSGVVLEVCAAPSPVQLEAAVAAAVLLS